jgi:hypothetical protein
MPRAVGSMRRWPADVVELFSPRRVPLGGLRAMMVDRLLPQRALPTVGAWCFIDQFGPENTDMHVLPHPHTGLQTVTWPFAGRVRHRDSIGSDVVIEPGQLDLMTSGRGIAHSEFSLGERPILHGLQMWVALPAVSASVAPGFEQHGELPKYSADGFTATVFMGTLADVTSPATTFSPLVGAQFELSGPATIPLVTDFEYAVLLTEGRLYAAGVALDAGPLLYLGRGRPDLALSTVDGARGILLGGEPYVDDLVMWWNFVGRTHEDIVVARTDWEARADRFAPITGHGSDRIPAPPMPASVRLLPRNSRR